MPNMSDLMGNRPSLNNSSAVNQGEIQKVKQKMNNSNMMVQGMTSNVTVGGAAGLMNSTAIGQQEVQKVKQKVQNSGNQSMGYNSLS
jgi:hypothetical protein